ncbi:uncharacterized protein CTRU02_215314 [Colletotrichum truncatum]|uniref:Uncharacterized protein n=1 Tax=Colletotrichum truncatum TaxID=5467 RepID=A0ACC3YCY6_COLTU
MVDIPNNPIHKLSSHIERNRVKCPRAARTSTAVKYAQGCRKRRRRKRSKA